MNTDVVKSKKETERYSYENEVKSKKKKKNNYVKNNKCLRELELFGCMVNNLRVNIP